MASYKGNSMGFGAQLTEPRPIDPLAEAIRIAAVAHAGQKDKAGQPYILHALRVGLAGETVTEKIVGFLHDVLEDTDFPVAALRQLFDRDIIEALTAITRDFGEGYRFYIERVAKNRVARRVKLNDLQDNLDRTRLAPEGTPELMDLRKRYRTALNYLEEVKDEKV